MLGGVLERLEGGICLECLCQRLCALGTDIVETQTANVSEAAASGFTDSRSFRSESQTLSM